MKYDSAPVLVYRFRELSAICPRTVALPLVMWHEVTNLDVEKVTISHLDFCSVYIVERGSGTHIIEGISYGIARGDVYAMVPGMKHRFADCHDLNINTLHFSPTIFDPPTLDALAATPGFQPLFVEEPLRRAETRGGGGRWLHLSPETHARVVEMLAELREEWLERIS